jgi:hypothetical protein
MVGQVCADLAKMYHMLQHFKYALFKYCELQVRDCILIDHNILGWFSCPSFIVCNGSFSKLHFLARLPTYGWSRLTRKTVVSSMSAFKIVPGFNWWVMLSSSWIWNSLLSFISAFPKIKKHVGPGSYKVLMPMGQSRDPATCVSYFLCIIWSAAAVLGFFFYLCCLHFTSSSLTYLFYVSGEWCHKTDAWREIFVIWCIYDEKLSNIYIQFCISKVIIAPNFLVCFCFFSSILGGGCICDC